MRVAVCGYPPLAVQVIGALRNSGIECQHFIQDFMSGRGETSFNIPTATPPRLVNFFEFRRMIESGTIDGLVICEEDRRFNHEVVKTCKLYGIPNVGCLIFSDPFNRIYWLNTDKAYLSQCEANVIDSCNLNCKACTHYSNLFNDDDVYSLEDFARDLKQISDKVDILKFYILGGEPLKLKNLDKYIKIARKFLPNSSLRLVTNGLLVPSTQPYIFEALRENKVIVEISLYPPTHKNIDVIRDVLTRNDITHQIRGKVEHFNAFLTLRGGHNPARARAVCFNDGCRFLRNGKIYKCPVDALSFKLTERFGIKNFPVATSVDIFAKNFPALIDQLDDSIELCTWCSENGRAIPWTPENKPALTDWLADPSELERLQN